MARLRVTFAIFFLLFLHEVSPTDTFVLPMIDWLANVDGAPTQNQLTAIQIHTASELAVARINNGTYPDILPHTTLELDVREDNLSVAKAVEEMINFANEGKTLIVGFPISAIAVPSASVGTAFKIAQVSGLSSANALSNDLIYPYYTRVTVGNGHFSASTKASLLFYESLAGRGWTDVALIATLTEYSISQATAFIELASPEITISTYQQYLSDSDRIDIELTQIKLSGARVIYAIIFGDWQAFIDQADEQGLVGDNYVWYVPGTVVGFPFLEPSQETRGAIGNNFHSPESPQLDDFLAMWRAADPELYPGAGPEFYPPSILTYRVYDMILTVAQAIDTLERRGQLDQPISAETWVETIRAVSFDGVSGPVSFEPNGDRIGQFSLQYYSPEAAGWITSAIWSAADGYELIRDVVWYSNTTDIPDLDIREPFDYWSCHDKKMKHDETGKAVTLRTPGSSDVDEINSEYYCDTFIDCKNLSDESEDCTSNYLVVFIVFGILAGLLILWSVGLFFFVILFGFILGYRKLRQRSPVFLIIILISVVIGYCSIFAWFGKPHPVACGFQPWLLGLSANSMIVALTVKNFRIWRIFKYPGRKTRISDIELCVLWLLLMIPALVILILWTIISTPTATLTSHHGEDHYVCETGGFTGPPGGIIFFSIFAGYSAIVLFLGAAVSIAVRNVPADYNETKLLAVSIYNLVLLSIVIVPVFLVVDPFNPFIAWILRTVAILYAFFATTALQFIPIVVGVFILDKGKNVRVFKSSIKTPNSPATCSISPSDSSG